MRAILFAFAVLFQVSCHNPTGRSYKPQTFQFDIEEIRHQGKFNDDELQQLTRYIVLAHLRGVELEGKSYDEIMDLLKNASRSFEDAAVRKNNNEKIKRERINPLVQITLISKNYMKSGEGEFIHYKMSLVNSTNKDIRTVIGNFSIQDLMEKEIKSVPVILKRNIHAMSQETFEITAFYNPANEQDKRLRSKELIDMRVVWNPEKIIFKDGKLLE